MVSTISTPRRRATATLCSQKVRQRSCGSLARRNTASRSAPGMGAALTSMAGHTISRRTPSGTRERGRVVEKS